MSYYIFNIKNFFIDNKIYFGLFDGLFNLTINEKHKVLLELNCIPSTYRSQKLRGTKNKELIKTILTYFNYNDFDFELESQYNILLSKIYYCCYYKIQRQQSELLRELNIQIDENNVLKPLLVLFRTLLYTSFELDYKQTKNIIFEDLSYLYVFKSTNYFTNEFKLIYQSFLFYYDFLTEKDQLEIDKLSLLHPKISWIWFLLKGSKAYMTRNYDIALANFDILLSEFISNNNLERYFIVLNNVACIYNFSGHYVASLKVTEKVIEYVFGSAEDIRRISDILMHYLFSKLMLECYQEIIDFISINIFDFKILNVISAITCIVAAYKLNESALLKKLVSLDFDDPNYLKFVSYIKNGDSSQMKNITKFPYLLKLRKKLLDNN